MKKIIAYEIMVSRAGEIGFNRYPDPVYEDRGKAEAKVKYLQNYREVNNMDQASYMIRPLDEAGVKAHNIEWDRWRSLID